MRTTVLALAATLVVPCALSAQVRNASDAAQAANKHYAQGWSAVRAESWDDAAREFQEAIDNDPKFALAYYSLGRAEMGRRDFAKAIAAYRKCRDLYTRGGEQFSNQMVARQRLTDRIFEYQAALNQATNQTSTAKTATQSQSLYVRELQAQIQRLEQARDRNTTNVSLETMDVPYFVPMALGAAYFRSGQFAEAEREYKEALDANAASGETHNNLAVLYLMTGRFEEAESEVRAAEKSGFQVNENLKGDIRKKRTGG